MAEAVLEKEKCGECGVDVREGTTFCYNCGARVAGETQAIEAEPDTVPEVAEDAAASNGGNSNAESDKLAAAATKRKRARVSHRKTAEYVWEPAPADNARLALVIAVVMFVLALGVVVLMLDW